MIVSILLKLSVLTFFAFSTNRFFTRLLERKWDERISFFAFCVYIVLIDFFVLGHLFKEFLDARAATLLQQSLIYFLQITVSQFCIFLIVHFFFKGNIFKKLAICSIHFVIWEVVGYAIVTPLSQLTLIFAEQSGGMPPSLVFSIPSTLKYGVICLLLHQISTRCKHLGANLSQKASILLFVPSLFILLILELVMLICGDIQVFYRLSHSAQGVNSSALFETADVFVVCAAAIFGLAANMMLVFGVNDAMKQVLTAAGLQMQVDHYRDLQANTQKLQSLRHDMKNHLIALSGLLARNEYGTAQEYMNRLSEEGGTLIGGVQTGNTAVDALIGTKQAVAENRGIQFDCDLKIPQLVGITDFDLCVILGNAFDNAIEACERIPDKQNLFISLESCIVKDYLLIDIKNSSEEKGLKRQNFTSNKAEVDNHGIGLINMKATVIKHSGAMNMKCENNVFDLSLMLPLNRS